MADSLLDRYARCVRRARHASCWSPSLQALFLLAGLLLSAQAHVPQKTPSLAEAMDTELVALTNRTVPHMLTTATYRNLEGQSIALAGNTRRQLLTYFQTCSVIASDCVGDLLCGYGSYGGAGQIGWANCAAQCSTCSGCAAFSINGGPPEGGPRPEDSNCYVRVSQMEIPWLLAHGATEADIQATLIGSVRAMFESASAMKQG